MGTGTSVGGVVGTAPSSRSVVRAIGLVGGVGPSATAYYSRQLVQMHRKDSPEAQLFIEHADLTRVLGFAEAGDTLGLARYLADFVQCLANAGAELAAISAVTPYMALPMLRELAPLPIIDMADVLMEVLAACDVKRVALFGTRTVVQSRFFGWLKEVEVVTPQPDEVERVHRISLAAAKQAEPRSKLREELLRIGMGLTTRERVEAIVLAETELTLLFNGRRAPEFAIIDCASLHIQAIAKAACQVGATAKTHANLNRPSSVAGHQNSRTRPVRPFRQQWRGPSS